MAIEIPAMAATLTADWRLSVNAVTAI